MRVRAGKLHKGRYFTEKVWDHIVCPEGLSGNQQSVQQGTERGQHPGQRHQGETEVGTYDGGGVQRKADGPYWS